MNRSAENNVTNLSSGVIAWGLMIAKWIFWSVRHVFHVSVIGQINNQINYKMRVLVVIFSVTDAELKRLKDAFKRSSTLNGYMTKQILVREVLGDGVPAKLAEVSSFILFYLKILVAVIIDLLSFAIWMCWPYQRLMFNM